MNISIEIRDEVAVLTTADTMNLPLNDEESSAMMQ